MAQLWIVMGGFALINFAIFTVGVDFYEENMMEDTEEGTVEIYEVEEGGAEAPAGVLMEEEAPAAAEEAAPQ